MSEIDALEWLKKLESKTEEIQTQLSKLSSQNDEMNSALKNLALEVRSQKNGNSSSAALLEEMIKAQIGTCNSLASIVSVVNAHDQLIKGLKTTRSGMNVCVMGQVTRRSEIE